MTTFQDPQPQSRRAVRQSERGEAAEPTVGFTQFPPTTTDAPQFTDPAASGRRSAGATPAQPAAEPLTYSTQSRVPSYDGPSFRSRSNAPVSPDNDALPPTQALPKAEQPSYRVRDFSPEGRRAAPASPAWNAPAAPAPVAPVSSTPLEYHTEARPAAPVAPPVPVAEVPADLAVPVERTLTRRELRAMQQAEGVAAADLVEPGRTPAAAAPVAAAPVAPVPPALVEPTATDEPQAWPFGNLFPDPAAAEVVAQPIAPIASVVVPDPVFPLVAPEPTTNTAVVSAIAEFDALTQQPPTVEEPARVFEDAPTSQWTAPVGHWSTQAGLDDETQPYENTINRTVGSGSVTTNALVLGAIPEGSDIRGPLTGTGEIMLTGSIDLPRQYTSTGATARIEQHGIDALFDLHDAEVVTTDSQPVRAISAVSTHNSGQGVTHTQKPKGTRALTALVISAASMAVVVVGLLIAVFALNIF